MDKRKVSVFVAGQRFNLITDEEERYVIDLASKIDARISSISISQNMTRERAAVLTALDFADDVEQDKREMTAVKEQVKDYLTQVEKLTAENSELKTRLSKEQLDAKALEDMRLTLADSDREKESLKRQILALKEQIEVMRENGYTAPDEIPAPQDAPDQPLPVAEQEDTIPAPAEDPVEAPAQGTPVQAAAPLPDAAPAVTAEDDLFFNMPEEPVRPRKDKKRHNHHHENPYRQQFMKKKDEQKGYTQQRQYSLFDEPDE